IHHLTDKKKFIKDGQQGPNSSRAIEQLKEAVKDLVEVRKDFEDDLFLLRWLKARNMDVKKAEKMARGWHHW
ncbi:unnamed protein product, partial [Allacma fusca]